MPSLTSADTRRRKAALVGLPFSGSTLIPKKRSSAVRLPWVQVDSMHRRRLRSTLLTVNNIPMMNADIVTGVSISLLMVLGLSAINSIFGTHFQLGFGTLLIAHITFNLPYVILNVMPKLSQMDKSLTDAAMDLGCTPLQSFFKVTLHEIMPGIVAGFIMAFTMSLDDFVISYFVTGMDFVTLPVEIYSYTKKPIPPKIYALFTILFLLIFVLLVTMNLLQMRAEKKKNALYSKR